MNLTIENILLVGSLLLFISIMVGKTSYKFGVPVLFLFLSIGMLVGSDGIGNIHFDDPKIAQFIGVVSLYFILKTLLIASSNKEVLLGVIKLIKLFGSNKTFSNISIILFCLDAL